MNYKEMNTFDIASVIDNLIDDDNRSLMVEINGERFHCWSVLIDNEFIIVKVSSSRITITPNPKENEDE